MSELIKDAAKRGLKKAARWASTGKYSPRQWMMEQKHDCRSSSAVMNEVIKQTMRVRGQTWTTDLCPLHWPARPAAPPPRRPRADAGDLRRHSEQRRH